MRHANVAFFVPHIGCPHQCSFCNQHVIAGEKPPTGDEVARTLRSACGEMEGRWGEKQIAFFGGSFTAVPLTYQLELLEAAQPFIETGAFSGIRVSTRPDAIDEETITRLMRYGVTAVELGAQSMDDRVLALNGRGHTAQDVKRASRAIREAGMELGLQMMTGLYGDTPGGAFQTAEELCELQPDTVRIYPTVVLEGTELARLFRKNRYAPQPLEEAVSLCARLLTLFEEKGIRVIRLGLHSGGNVEGGYVAGPYHPAFRELCESRRYRAAMEKALLGIPPGGWSLRVPRADISQAVGQKKENIRYFEERGYRLRILPGTALLKYEVKAEDGT